VALEAATSLASAIRIRNRGDCGSAEGDSVPSSCVGDFSDRDSWPGAGEGYEKLTFPRRGA
jgi:hypothetical protein